MSLARFHEAQASRSAGYDAALAEIRRGRKTSHWIWYIFPQLAGIGRSSMAEKYAIRDLAEACDYLRDPRLRSRYEEITAAVSHQFAHGLALEDLMVNPMLVSLLYKAYSYHPKVPFKKQIFYRQVFDALFDMHDSTKGGAFVRKKHCNLDIDEFHLVMRDLGFTTAKLGKIEYEKDAISDIIKSIRERN